MTNKNPYRKSAHFWTGKTKQIIRLFCEDLTASSASRLLWIERKSINSWYNYFREVIYRNSLSTDQEVRDWIIEVDESYFWAKRIKGKRWRGAGNKTKVLWLLKRQGKVFVQVIPDCSAKSILPIIRGKIDPNDSIVNTDWWRSYNWLIDLWYKKHYRVRHSQNEFARWNKHINWIESFRSFTKRRLSKFNWISNHKFVLHLKECERRFNCWLQKENKYKQLMKMCRKFALFSS